VLIDTSAYYALVNPHDTHHTAALTIQIRLVAESPHLHTTNFIVAECHALLLNRLFRGNGASRPRRGFHIRPELHAVRIPGPRSV